MLGNLFAGAICATDGHQNVKRTHPERPDIFIEQCDRCGEMDWEGVDEALIQARIIRDGYQAEERRRFGEALRVVSDLDRCPHGRHQGDSCAGWRGPGAHDGGCQGGVSLGNPLILPGKTVIGYNLYAAPIIMPIDRVERAELRGWIRYTP